MTPCCHLPLWNTYFDKTKGKLQIALLCFILSPQPKLLSFLKTIPPLFSLLQPPVSVNRPYCLPATSPRATAPHSCSQRRQVVQPPFSGRPALSVPRGRWSVCWSASIIPSTSDPCPPSLSRGSLSTKEIRKSGFTHGWTLFLCPPYNAYVHFHILL